MFYGEINKSTLVIGPLCARFDEKPSMAVQNLRKQSFLDRQMNGKRDNVKTVKPPTNTVCKGSSYQPEKQIQYVFDDI